jgi:hypothetical protein
VHRGRVDKCGNVIYSGKFHQKLKFCKENYDLLKFESSEVIKIIEGEVQMTGICGQCDSNAEVVREHNLYAEF